MTNEWFFENLYPDIKIGLKIKKKLNGGHSRFQKINLFQSYSMGKVLALDGAIQTTTADEFIYHEMMTHIPLFSHPRPRNVLIIGGGDGGVLREVLKHKTVKKVTLVEIDKKVVEYCKKNLPEICRHSFENKKLELIIGDGAEFVKNTVKKYDIAIIDSPDPLGPARVLFQNQFYKNISGALRRYGIAVRQSGSTFLQREELKENYRKLKNIFRYVSIYTAAIPTYIGGLFSFIFASQEINPEKLHIHTLKKKYSRMNFKTKYYNPEIHEAAFKLPNYIKKLR